MESNFNNDLNIEVEISKFVDKYLYSKLDWSFKRYNTKEEQIKGIDVSLDYQGNQMFIDDKCAFYYANKNLRTFTFELSYLNKGVSRKGWLLKQNMQTSHYNVMWLNTKDKNINLNDIKLQNIKDIESMIISKNDLLTYLTSLGYDDHKLTQLDYDIRYSNTTRQRLTPHIELLISNRIAEKPVNIKIEKTELAKLAVMHLKVSEDNLFDYKTNSIFNVPAKINFKQYSGLHAELKVLDTIKKYSIGRDCHTFLHFPLHQKEFQGRKEIDILVLDRQTGISVIEVKGIRINQIKTIHGGDWFYTNFYTNKGNPYKQGENQLNMLCNELEKEPLLFRRFTKRVVIALPYITRAEWESRGFHQLINTPPVLLKDDLEGMSGIKKLEYYYIYKANQALDNRQWSLMKNFFAIEDENSSAIANRYSMLFVFSTKEQFQMRKLEIEQQLKSGIKVILLCYFTMDKEWNNSLKDYENAYQLQCFSSKETVSLEKTIEIEDGEDELPRTIIHDFPSFNYKQYQAVHAPVDKNLMVTAGAGTGKTHAMIDRIIFLLSKKVSLKDIIMITFTNDSTNEMKKRLQKKLIDLSMLTGKTKFGLYAEDIKEMQISTIHSFSKSILISLAHEIGYGKNIRLRSFIQQKKKIIHELIDEFYHAKPGIPTIHSFKHYELVKIIQQFWDEMEKKGLSKEEIRTLEWGEAEETKHRSIHQLFQYVFQHNEDRLDEIKKNENAVSMNDLIRKLKSLSHDEKKMKQLEQNKYLFMDEFQDSDNVQIDLVASLANYLNYKLFVVGDVKQSIYRFRGADYKSFDLLEKKVKKELSEFAFLKLSLNQNYRTASSILEKLDHLFVKWGKREWLSYKDKLVGVNNRNERVDEFQFISVNHKQTESITIDTIRHSIEQTKVLSKQENRKTALIVRTNRQAREVNEWCKKANIKTLQNLDGTFYTSKAVRDFKNLLDGLLFPQEAKHVLNALQSPYFRYKIPYKVLLPFNGRDEAILSFIHSKIGDSFINYVDQLKIYPVMAVIQKIISENGIFHHLAKFYKDQFNQVQLENFLLKYKNNLFHLMNIIQQQFDMMDTTLYNIYQWLTLQMRTNRTENEPMVETTEHSVEITTVHRAKGLEYHTVIIPKTTNPFDYKRTTFYIEEAHDEDKEGREVAWFIEEVNSCSSLYGKLEEVNQDEIYKEETRLLYVAMTRAKERLVVNMPTYVKNRTWAELIRETGIKVVPYDR